MNRLLCSIMLIGLACVAGAQPAGAGGSAKTLAARDVGATTLEPRVARSFNDVRADRNPGPDARAAVNATPAIPEPQPYTLLLAGLGAIVFVAVRRSP